MITFMWSQQ